MAIAVGLFLCWVISGLIITKTQFEQYSLLPSTFVWYLDFPILLVNRKGDNRQDPSASMGQSAWICTYNNLLTPHPGVVPPKCASINAAFRTTLRLKPITFITLKLNIRVHFFTGRGFGNQKHFRECGADGQGEHSNILASEHRKSHAPCDCPIDDVYCNHDTDRNAAPSSNCFDINTQPEFGGEDL